MENVAERAEAPGPGALEPAAPFPGPPAPKTNSNINICIGVREICGLRTGENLGNTQNPQGKYGPAWWQNRAPFLWHQWHVSHQEQNLPIPHLSAS